MPKEGQPARLITEEQGKVQAKYFGKDRVPRLVNGNPTGKCVGKADGKAVGKGKGKGTPAAQQQRNDQLRADSVRVGCLCRRADCAFTLTGNQATYAYNWRSHLLSSAGCADAVRQGCASGTTEFNKARKHLVEVWTTTAGAGKKWLEKKASLAWREAGRPTDQEFSVSPSAFR